MVEKYLEGITQYKYYFKERFVSFVSKKFITKQDLF